VAAYCAGTVGANPGRCDSCALLFDTALHKRIARTAKYCNFVIPPSLGNQLNILSGIV